ncbi:MAG: coenzyme F420-0:L-glutamate ligase [Methermicoccaceae archaeon]
MVEVREVSVVGIPSKIIHPGDDVCECIIEGIEHIHLKLKEGDVVVVSESALATAEGRMVVLSDVSPSPDALALADRYELEPELAELVMGECDEILGGISGFVLTVVDGFLCPNAGIDRSNAPEGCAILMPSKPEESARNIRIALQKYFGCRIGVVISDSRTHPMRLGCTGIALACSGFDGVVDERGKKDIFGKPLEITRVALADNIASSAQMVMGEAGEKIPFCVVRGSGAEMMELDERIPVMSIEECLYMGSLLSDNHHLTSQ